MKKILFPGIALVVLLLCLPFYGGYKAEQRLNSIIDTINKSPGYTVEYQSYTKSWLKTYAVLNVNFTAMLADAEPASFDAPITIEVGHGPLLLNDENKLGWFSYRVLLPKEDINTLSEFVTLEEEGDIFQTYGYMNLLGDTKITNVILPFSFGKSDEKANFSGYTGMGVLSRTGALVYEGTLGEFSVEGEGESFFIAESTMNVESDLSRMVGSAGLAPGKATINFPKLQFLSGENKGFLENVVMNVDVVLPKSKPVINMDLGFNIGKGSFAEETFSDFTLSFAYKNISLSLMESYMAMLKEQSGSASNMDPGQFFTPEMVEEALRYKPGVSINPLGIKLKEGKALFDLAISFEGMEGVPPDALKQNPMLALQGLNIVMNAQADKTLARRMAYQKAKTSAQNQVAMEQASGAEGVQYSDEELESLANQNADVTLQMLIDQNMIVEDAGAYKSSFVFEKGETKMNGVVMPFPLGALMGLGGN